MPFRKGQPRPKNAGRKKGSLNKTTVAARAALNEAFAVMGGSKALVKWAKDNETEFYKLWGRLIPVDIAGEGGGPAGLTIRVVSE